MDILGWLLLGGAGVMLLVGGLFIALILSDHRQRMKRLAKAKALVGRDIDDLKAVVRENASGTTDGTRDGTTELNGTEVPHAGRS